MRDIAAPCLRYSCRVPFGQREELSDYGIAPDEGHVDVGMQVALCSHHGERTTMNLIGTPKYFRLGAERNLTGGQGILGIVHFIGIGYCVDIAGAEEIFRLATNQRNGHGDFNYAIRCLRHIKSGSDSVELSRSLKSSADQRVAKGEVSYRICLLEGFGVTVDLRQPARYFGNFLVERMHLDHSIIGFAYLKGRVFQTIKMKLLDVLKFLRSKMIHALL